MTPIEKLYTIEEVAKILHFNPMTIYRAIKAKKIKALRVGMRQWRIKERSLKEFLENKSYPQR